MSIQINNINAIDDDRNFSAAGIVTVGTGNSATIIDGTTGITSVGIGVTIDGIAGNISIAGTITAAGFNVPPTPVSFNPTSGATEVVLDSDIEIIFDQYITGFATDKNVTLREDSGIGTVLQTIPANSGAISINNATITITPPSPLKSAANIYVVVDEGAFTGSYSAPNPLIDDYQFTTAAIPPLGGAYEGGYLICCSGGGTLWIVAPSSSEVTRTWFCRNDANTTAQQVSGCTGWFVPNCSQLKNPAYTCRTYWDSYSSTNYWSSTQDDASKACIVAFNNGVPGHLDKSNTARARVFRTVSY